MKSVLTIIIVLIVLVLWAVMEGHDEHDLD